MTGDVAATDLIRVMTVEDHALVRRSVVSLLETCSDIQVVGEAEDGVQAVAMAAELMPDLILMDIQMPSMDGLEATRRIKAAHPSLKIVMLTVVDDAGTLSKALKAGAEAYFLKSMAPDDFLVRLLSIFRGTAPLRQRGDLHSPKELDRVSPFFQQNVPSGGLPPRGGATDLTKGGCG